MSRKAKTKLLALDDYVVFDTETTGLDAQWCEIIELAAIKVHDGVIVDKFCSLIKPEDYPIDDFVIELTGITNEMLEDAPSIDEVLPGFESFIDGYKLIGHNVCFDAKFITAALGRELDVDLVDTMRISRHVNKNLSKHKLGIVYDYCVAEGVDKLLGRSHRAEYDATITQLIYEHLKNKLIQLYGEDPEVGWKKFHSSNNHSFKTKKGDIIQTVDEIDDSNPF